MSVKNMGLKNLRKTLNINQIIASQLVDPIVIVKIVQI